MTSFAPTSGLSSLLKEGTKHISGVDAAVLKNIDACTQLGALVSTSLGPHARRKIVVNRLGKLFVTSDAATILRELEVIHPAAQLLVKAAEAQEREAGDGTAAVVILASALLENAENMLRMGLHTSEIIAGYEQALVTVLKELETLPTHRVNDVKSLPEVSAALTTCIASKQYSLEGTLAPLVADACLTVLPSNPAHFSVENVRVAKILGGSLSDSVVVHGSVLTRDMAGVVKKVDAAKVAVFTCDFDSSQTETKGTVLIKSAAQLTDYTRSEEAAMDAKVRDLVDAGVTVVASPKFGDVALHFLDTYKVAAIKCASKFDLRRVARTTGAVALAKLSTPTADEIGRCDQVVVEEVGSTKVTVLRQKSASSRVATVVLRGSTANLMEDVERVVDDAVNVFKGITKDGRFVAGAGATEMALAARVQKVADAASGLEQYALEAFGTSLATLPKRIAENAGLDAPSVMAALTAAHAAGNVTTGVNVEGGDAGTASGVANTLDAAEAAVWDQYAVKYWSIRLAAEAALTVLRVDQIIMAKEAGGPKPRDMLAADVHDDAP